MDTPGRAEIALFGHNCSPIVRQCGFLRDSALAILLELWLAVAVLYFAGRRATPAMARNDPEGQESPANEEPGLD
jgi:hypothetical protein